MIEIIDVYKNFGDKQAVKGVTFNAADAVQVGNYYTNISDNSWVGDPGANGIVISDCTFTGTPQDASKYIPIFIDNGGRSNAGSKNITITGCKFFVNAFNFIRLDYIEAGTTTISGNIFGGATYTTGHHAINMSGNASDVVVEGNTFINWKTNKTAFATGRHTGYAGNVAISVNGNTFSNTVVPGDGDDGVIEIKTNSYNATNCTVDFSGNFFEGALAGLDETTVKHVKP